MRVSTPNLKPIKIKLSNSNFSIVTYNFKSFISDSSMMSIISAFFKQFINEGKYFLLLKLNYVNSSYKTMHKGVVISSDSLDAYQAYCLNILSLKSNHYHSEMILEIEFNFFRIDPFREQYYIDKWTEVKPVESIKLKPFSNSIITTRVPYNRDYSS